MTIRKTVVFHLLASTLLAFSTSRVLSEPLSTPPVTPQRVESSFDVNRIASLVWMAGHWQSSEATQVSEEAWFAPKGGIMLGLNRTVITKGPGQLHTSFEFLRIAETKEGVFYFASPGGKKPIRFRLVEAGPSHATFTNPKHDFPSKIVYKREKETLTATIEGTIQKQHRNMTFSWTRMRDKE